MFFFVHGHNTMILTKIKLNNVFFVYFAHFTIFYGSLKCVKNLQISPNYTYKVVFDKYTGQFSYG